MKHENTVKTEKANENELVKILAGNCESIKDIRELLKNLFKGTLEEMLESETEEHLGTTNTP